MTMRSLNGRGWAYAGAILGAAVSIAANVAHSYVPPADAPDGWHPHLGAVISAAFWPAALIVAVEILSRVPWPDGRRWVLIRYGGLLPVAAVAALVSYQHLSGLLGYYKEATATATLGPAAIDGLMLLSTAALIATTGQHVLAATVAATVELETQPATTPARMVGADVGTNQTEPTSKRQHIVDALHTTGGNVAATRQLLADRGITAGREYVYRIRREAWQPAQ